MIGAEAIGGSEKWTYGYDNKNELIEAKHYDGTGALVLTADYKYDVFGKRVEEDDTDSSGTTVTRFALDGWNPANPAGVGNTNFNVFADLNGSSSLTTRYLYGDKIDQLLARIDGATPRWYVTDHLGSVRDVIDNTGTVKDAIAYDAFGNIFSGETAPAYRGRYAWTGRELDVETGLQYNRARYYDSTTGRWVSQDPLGFDAGDSNLYRYVNNWPTRATDPSGKQERSNDGSNIQWITQATMKDLVQHKLAYAVKGNHEAHRVVITPYGRQIRVFDYKEAINPATGGLKQWALARTYGLSPIDGKFDIETLVQRQDTEANAKKYAKFTDDEALVGAKAQALESAITVITMLPLVGTADALVRKDYVDAAISFVGDVALLGPVIIKGAARAAIVGRGGRAAAALARPNTALIRFQAVEGAIALTRLGQAGIAVMQDENAKAVGYLGEALLRIFGIAYTRRAVLRSARIAGQHPRVSDWRLNPGGQARSEQEIAQILRQHGVSVPDDVRFVVGEANEFSGTLEDLVSGRVERVETARLSRLQENRNGDVFFRDLYNRDGVIPIQINPSMLRSDEAIVAVATHELHELANFRAAFDSQRGRMSFGDFVGNSQTGRSGNFHDLAWDAADEAVQTMRRNK